MTLPGKTRQLVLAQIIKHGCDLLAIRQINLNL
jgi:hypothetical protein